MSSQRFAVAVGRGRAGGHCVRGGARRRRGDGRRSEQAFATERVTHRRWGWATRAPALTGCDFRPAVGLIGGSFVEAAVVR